MSRERSRPSDVILDMLRSARSRRRSVQSLIAAGRLFDLTENTMRVTLSRLMARGIIESPARGLYRLADTTDALNDFVERWRLGDKRMRPWTSGHWLFAHQAPASGTSNPATGDTGSSLWALDALGFREVQTGLHVRPDNLNLTLAGLRELARSIGLAGTTLLFCGTPETGAAEKWPELWNPRQLDRDYGNALERLEASTARLPALPQEAACLECFSLGGEMIHRLAKDPLLPEQFVNASARTRLWRRMLDYDALGKEIWTRGRQGAMDRMPHPKLASGVSAGAR
ncbi:MAG: hypothetical protein R3E82_01920 [Pseudomonadales bacterium]|nr:hypothetical protein [Pseudomonadales bacterium]